MEKLTVFCFITASILVSSKTYSQGKAWFSEAVPLIKTINNHNTSFSGISSNIIEDDFFYYDSLKIDHKGQGNHLSILLFSTSATLENSREFSPEYVVEAMDISLENLIKVKIKEFKIELIMKNEWGQPGEKSSYRITFKVNNEADFEKISRSFNLLAELLKELKTKHED